MNNLLKRCPVDFCIKVVGGKWKPLILWHLKDHGVRRYGQLMKDIGSITQKMLTQQLRALEEDGIVIRKVYPVVPPKVEYRLSASGKDVIPILDHMANWGIQALSK